MIRIIYPKPGEVSRMGGLQLLEVEADTEAEIMDLTSRIDDGVQVFIAAPGSIAHTPDYSADWEFGPAGTWVKRGGRGGGTAPAPVVILPETELTFVEDEGTFAVTTPWETDLVVGGVYKVTYNGTDYECEGMSPPMEGMPDGFVMMGDFALVGVLGDHADVPFLLLSYPTSFGAEMGIYGAIVPGDGATSVTLSIVQTGGVSADKGNDGIFTVNVPVTNYYTDTGHDFGAFDKTFAELVAAQKAGKIVRISVNWGNGVSTYGTVIGFGDMGAESGVIISMPISVVNLPHNVVYILSAGENGEIIVQQHVGTNT